MRNQDTSAATAANVKRKHERWIKELTDAGYTVVKCTCVPVKDPQALHAWDCEVKW